LLKDGWATATSPLTAIALAMKAHEISLRDCEKNSPVKYQLTAIRTIQKELPFCRYYCTARLGRKKEIASGWNKRRSLHRNARPAHPPPGLCLQDNGTYSPSALDKPGNFFWGLEDQYSLALNRRPFQLGDILREGSISTFFLTGSRNIDRFANVHFPI
jgi:hypothetical protein